ncbi:NAD(P)-binding protein [Coemansia reversa NRRL 1564]|uniref:NAD(P)-binding protein n=1 Tax=Coemansia reversa (strain ATCC 12441 / NRRL 1564) TaxID=763665 RepID=A0A2G5B954_COERN|nr:NAD(P)-binding protein [Coemansia reversa NRRL 1564]|eukprot:PIA15512.1 NAD(P)-binding protein [Coemansia reversa NRRL 1564]
MSTWETRPTEAAAPSSGRGPVAIVTGASRGLGREISMALLRNQVSVIGVGRSADSLNELTRTVVSQSENKGGAQFIPCVVDITTTEGVNAIEKSLKNSGLGLVALINNAGTLGPVASIASASIEAWKTHFDVNLFAVVELTRRILPELKASKPGRVINISSGASIHPYRGWGAYCACKAAVNMLTQSLAHEESDVVAVAVRPGVLDTEMQNYIRSKCSNNMHVDEYNKFVQLHKSGKLMHPSKPAMVIANLALNAPVEMSGSFYSWDADELAKFRS